MVSISVCVRVERESEREGIEDEIEEEISTFMYEIKKGREYIFIFFFI